MTQGALTSVGGSGTEDVGKKDRLRKIVLTTWPSYHDPATFEAFTARTGIAVELNIFTTSTEDVLDRVKAGEARDWDMLVPTNYAIATHAELGTIEPLDMTKLPHYDPSAQSLRFIGESIVNGKTYAVPKNWGSTGIAYNADKFGKPVTSWKQFFELAQTEAAGRTIIHDYQLTAVGNALVALGYSFSSLDPKELAEAEALLMQVKPFLHSITNSFQPAMRATDAWLTMCWPNDGTLMNRDMPQIQYVLGEDGGEIWGDFYAIFATAPNKEGAYALLDYLMTPEVAAREHIANGTATSDKRVLDILPAQITASKISYPDAAALAPQEVRAAPTLVDPIRAEIMARFKAA